VNPGDLDLVLFVVPAPVTDGNVVWSEIVEQMDRSELAEHSQLDVFVEADYPVGHPLRWRSVARRRYWTEEFGHDRDNRPKGILVLRLV
jgi:hypothetical protein